MKRIKYILHKIRLLIFQKPRILKYNILSNIKETSGNPLIFQPTLFLGDGFIRFGENVNFGVFNSPGFYNGVTYLESRNANSKIIIGDNVWINNNFTAISDGASITIGKNSLIGFNVVVLDSDFHSLNPKERRSGKGLSNDVFIGENVFIGANVTILKGVTIGNNSVIGSGSIVHKSFSRKCNNWW